MSEENEKWILGRYKPKRTDTAPHYDRMEMQSGGELVEIYKEPDVKNPWHWRDTAICAAFVEAVNAPNGVILDVGPGDGWPSLVIARHFKKVVGIDPSRTRVKVQTENARRLGMENCEFRTMDVNNIEYDDETFDGVIAASSIEQSRDPEKGLAECFRVLKPGKCLAMFYENYDTYGPDGGESEEVEVVDGDGQVRLLYKRCTRKPPREAQYTLFFDGDAVKKDTSFTRHMESIRSDESAWLEANRLADVLGDIQKYCSAAEYYELSHFTTDSLERSLRNTGYVNIRGFGKDVNGFMQFVKVAIDMGRALEFKDTFMGISELFGIAAVRYATPRPMVFCMADKP